MHPSSNQVDPHHSGRAQIMVGGLFHLTNESLQFWMVPIQPYRMQDPGPVNWNILSIVGVSMKGQGDWKREQGEHNGYYQAPDDLPCSRMRTGKIFLGDYSPLSHSTISVISIRYVSATDNIHPTEFA